MDVEGLLRSLKEHKVRFVIIGATAFPVHGYSRATLDIDIFIEPTPLNAKRAQYDLDTADAMFTAGRYLYVLFCCQQAVQR